TRAFIESWNLLVGNESSINPQSFARLPLSPSASVEKTSARSRLTFLLSTRRVRPPVPGSTPSSGTSGRETAELPSSTRYISSQAIASSYPPPEAVPLRAARYFRPEWRGGGSLVRRGSFFSFFELLF